MNGDFEFSFRTLLDSYRAEPLWTLFLTSTALHAIVLIASPIQAVRKWVFRGSTGTDTPIPYVFALLGSALWLRYFLFIGDVKLILLQSYAVTLQTSFLGLFVFYSSKKMRMIRPIIVLTVAILMLFNYVSLLPLEDGRNMIGRFASAAQISASLVCPYLVYRAVTSKVIDFVPFVPIVFTFVMELHAIIYSVAIDDFYMTLANGFFCIMDGLVLSMFFVYPTDRQNSGKEDLLHL